jgi:hypothetical protein
MMKYDWGPTLEEARQYIQLPRSSAHSDSGGGSILSLVVTKLKVKNIF